MKNKKIKVLVSSQDSVGYGGAEIFLYHLAKEFKRNRVETDFTAVSGSVFEEFLKKNNFPTSSIPLRMDILGWWKGLIKFFLFLPVALVLNYGILKEFKNNGGQVVIIPGFSDKLTLTPLASLLGLSVVWIELPPLKTLFMRNFYIPKVLYSLVSGMPDKIVPCSENTKRSLIEDARIDRAKIKVIPCGIEMLPPKKIATIRKKRKNIRKTLGVEDKFVVGMVSRIDEREKGQDTLLRAAVLLKNEYKNLAFLLVGGGDKKAISSLISELGLEREIQLLGFRKDIFEIISTFDVFAFPTRWPLEGFGLAPLEAMMMRVPVVASNFGPVPEVVGNSAFLVDPSPKGVARGVERILKDSKIKQELVTKGAKRVKKFDIKNIGHQYLELFSGLR